MKSKHCRKPNEPNLHTLVSFNRPRHPTVVLGPGAFLKLMFCCHHADTEIGGFGIASESDPLLIEEFVLVSQTASVVTVEFDDAAVADHVDRYADQGIEPNRSLRVWIHTHPASSASPSSTDEHTFARSFGGCEWAAMLIQSREQENYCRLRFNAGPGGQLVVPVVFDWASLPEWLALHADHMSDLVGSWIHEMEACIRVEPFSAFTKVEIDRGIRIEQAAADMIEVFHEADEYDRYELTDDAAAWLAQFDREEAKSVNR